MTGLLHKVATEIDRHVRDTVQAKLVDAETTVNAVQNFTPHVFFERVSGDWNVVRNVTDLPQDAADKLRQAFCLGRVANVDEVCATFMDFGLIQEAKKGNTQAHATGVNPFAGQFNRFLQFGESARSLKTCAGQGQSRSPPTSLSMLGNMHPEIAIPMERGLVGSHTGATEERIFLFTAKRVQPHSALPEGYVLPDGHDPWAWIQLDPELADLCGLRECLSDPEMAERLALTRAIVPNPDEMPCQTQKGTRSSSQMEWESRIPWEVSGDETVAQIRVGNRDFLFPPAHCLSAVSRRVLNSFKTPNQRLVLSPEALETARSIGTLYQVKAGIASDAGDDQASALWGIATWKLAMLTGLLFVFEMFVNQRNHVLGDQEVVIARSTVLRARKLLGVLQA